MTPTPTLSLSVHVISATAKYSLLNLNQITAVSGCLGLQHALQQLADRRPNRFGCFKLDIHPSSDVGITHHEWQRGRQPMHRNGTVRSDRQRRCLADLSAGLGE